MASPGAAAAAGRPIRAIAFDAYGTLFDVYSLSRLLELHFPGKGAAMAAMWREKQVQYTFLRTLGKQHKSFWGVTEDALNFTAAAAGAELAPELRAQLRHAYHHMQPFPESLAALQALRAAGVRLAILSNGSADMLQAAVSSAGMAGLFEHVLSADSVACYKVADPVYELGPRAFGLPAQDIGFVSSNGWDAAGATWYGYHTFWVNRGGQPLEQLGCAPAAAGSSLADLVAYVQRVNAGAQ